MNSQSMFLPLVRPLCYLSLCGVLSAHQPESQLMMEERTGLAENEGSVHLHWDSRYFSEGRDNLDGDSLMSTGFLHGGKHVTAGAWYGFSPDQEYDELQLSLILSHEIGNWEFYGAYTHIRTPFDSAYDNELGLGVIWSGLPAEIELAADGYYSFDAEGAFIEFSVLREYELTESLAIGAAGIVGVNQGYVSDGHDGWNHFALQLEGVYAINDCWSASVHATYSWALDRDVSLAGDELLRDFFHFGVGLEWGF
ncbi:hypothetical protein [Persicirhabdus sediminis]|uniref:Uncharacterized protein n=1 Tax=Persicirhabdus sediminis TaxID=454144 RepID=A0A8J7MBU0_9BACT|nr:hypothetical protein [Persicirhabdus sediminis]MBK1790577.1 hypothetical protein [Persicirhabdus sediminis]